MAKTIIVKNYLRKYDVTISRSLCLEHISTPSALLFCQLTPT